MHRLFGVPRGRNTAQELTLLLPLLCYHVASNAEIQPLQSWLQLHVHALPQPVVHSEGPQQDEEH